MLLATRLSQALLYAFGAFFCYPWKPFVQLAYGSPYKVAYTHFRRDHSEAVNLSMHLVCLAFQLITSFALLTRFSEHHGIGWLPAVSVGCWLVSLLTAPCPLTVRAGSAACIAGTMYIAKDVQGPQIELITFGSFGAVFIAQIFLKGEKRAPISEGLMMTGVFATWLGFSSALTYYAGGSLKENVTELTVGFLVLMILIGASGNPVVPSAATGAVGARVLAILTSEPMLFLYGCAFIGSLLQGIAHLLSRQKATLVQHQNAFADKSAKVAFEWAHVVFFPNLVLHSVKDSLKPSHKY